MKNKEVYTIYSGFSDIFGDDTRYYEELELETTDFSKVLAFLKEHTKSKDLNNLEKEVKYYSEYTVDGEPINEWYHIIYTVNIENRKEVK